MATDPTGGSKAAGLGVAAAVVALLVLLPFMVVVAFYAFANVQAIITGSDLSSRSLSVPVFLIVLVGTVALLILGLFGIVSLIGRSFSPKRRKDRAEPFEEVREA
jgi:TRAP-type mannitol/chloroaromatic compound transport system permease small subunit